MITVETQYREVYESWRQRTRLIWQIPSVAAAVDGALIVSTFGSIDNPCVRGFVLLFGFGLTLVLTHAVYKHRYFSEVEQETLTALEDAWVGVRCLRTTQPTEGGIYRAIPKKIKFHFLANRSAERCFLYFMCFADLLLLALFVYNLLDYLD